MAQPLLTPISTGLWPDSHATAASMSSRASTSSSTARYRLSLRTSAIIMPPIATRPWSIITMLRPSAPTMPSTTRTSTITWLRSSNNEDLILAIHSAGVSNGRNAFFASEAAGRRPQGFNKRYPMIYLMIDYCALMEFA